MNHLSQEEIEQLIFEISNKPIDKNHTHVWKEYIGFTEKFEFCEICNERKENV